MKVKEPALDSPAACRKAIVRILKDLGHGHNPHTVFSDFVAMSAYALANRVDYAQSVSREAEYTKIVGRYAKPETEKIAQAFGALALAFQLGGPDDVLGSIYMEAELGNKYGGQFFTPFHLCQMMAKMTLCEADARARIAEKGFITMMDPCVGGGAMPIAHAQEMQAIGLDIATQLHITCQDISETSVHMAYVQLSLLGVPAVVILGNALACEERQHWFTPAHILNGWSRRLRAADARVEHHVAKGSDAWSSVDRTDTVGIRDHRVAVDAPQMNELVPAAANDDELSPSIARPA